MLISDILLDLERITDKINDNCFMELSRTENETLEEINNLFSEIDNEYSDIITETHDIYTSVESKGNVVDNYENDYCELTNQCVDATNEIDDLISILENENKRITRTEIINRLNDIKSYIEQ